MYKDAATTLYNDAETSLINDLGSLTRDIATALEGIAHVQAAGEQLGTDGVEAATEAANSISAAKGAITAATTAANTDINKVNNAVATAYTVANGFATGPCDGIGRGARPPGSAHLRPRVRRSPPAYPISPAFAGSGFGVWVQSSIGEPLTGCAVWKDAWIWT